MAQGIGQHASVTESNASSYTTPSRTTSSSGSNFYVFITAQPSSFAATPITDSKSNTYTQVGTTLTNAGSSLESRVYKCENGTGGASHTWTVSLTSTTYAALMAVELTGMALTSSVEQQGRQEDNATPFVTPSVTTTQANQIILAACFEDSSGTTSAETWGGSFTNSDLIEELTNAGTGVASGLVAKAVTSAGSYQGSLTISGVTVNSTNMHIITVKEASGGGASNQLAWIRA